MDTTTLLKNGYIEFNLKDLNIDLYNQLIDTFPNEESMIDLIDIWTVSKHLDINHLDFFNKYKSDFPDWDSNEEKIKNIEHSIKSAQHDNHLCGRFHGTYDELLKIRDYVNDNFDGNKTDSWLTKFDMENTIPWTKKLMSGIIDSFYDSNSYDINKQGINLSCYSYKDFLQKHTDDDFETRVCVVLVYLNHNWNPSNGGQLAIGDTIIEPEFGKVIILDNTDNSVEHEVLSVTHGNRFALSCFVLNNNFS